MSRFVIWLAAYGLALLSATFAARYGFKEGDTAFDQWLRGAALFGIAIVALHGIAWGAKLWHKGHGVVATLVASGGLFCFAVTLAGGVGTMAGSKDKLVSERGAAAAHAKGISTDIARAEKDLGNLPESRPLDAITPLLDIARANPRYSASNGCVAEAITRPDTRQHCIEFRRLEAEAGTARRKLELEEKLAELRRKQSAVVQVVAKDPQAAWLARILRIDPEDAQAYYGGAVSFALEIAGAIAILTNEIMAIRAAADAVAAAKAAAQNRARTTEAIDATFEAAPEQAPKALPAPDTVVQLRPKSEGSVARFLAQMIEAEEGAETDVETAYGSYQRWCEHSDKHPIGPLQFAVHFSDVCRAAKIATSGYGADLRALDVKMIA